MNYFFPSLLSSDDLKNYSTDLEYTVDSGENAIRLLLRSYNLEKNSLIAVPVYVCDSLKTAITKENFKPFYLDLKKDKSFWTNYDIKNLENQKISAIVLVHLYGFIHPDTEEIMNYCKINNIFLIHDTAQSYGINESVFTFSSGTIYSFGGGKSSTAAGGAIVKGLEKDFYLSNVTPAKDKSIQTILAKLFLKSRIYGYAFSLKDKIIKFIFTHITLSTKIKTMTAFQKQAAIAVMDLVEKRKDIRLKNYLILKNALQSNIYVDIVHDAENGQYFKLILKVKFDEIHYKNYLEKHNVPFFCLFDSMQVDKKDFESFRYLSFTAPILFEISTEASLPEKEMMRIATKLKNYSFLD